MERAARTSNPCRINVSVISSSLRHRQAISDPTLSRPGPPPVPARINPGGRNNVGEAVLFANEPPLIVSHLYRIQSPAVELEQILARGGAIEPLDDGLLVATPRGRLALFIIDPDAFAPGTSMGGLTLKEEEARLIADFLAAQK